MEADKNILEAVQQRAVRMISGLRSDASYEDRCKEIGLDTLEVRRIKQDLVQTFKILKGIDRVEWEEVFTKSQDIAIRTTRTTTDPMNLVVPRARLDIRKNSFFVRAPMLWNLLPKEAKNAKTIATFNNAISNVTASG